MSEDMLEYVFFHKLLAEKFAKKVREYNINASLVEDEPAWEVHISEDIDDDIEAKISDYYDELFDQDQDMYEQEHQADDGYQAAGIEITLSTKEKIFAQTDQNILGKVLSSVSFDEFNQLVGDIVFAVENPDTRSICQRYRDLKDKEV